MWRCVVTVGSVYEDDVPFTVETVQLAEDAEPDTDPPLPQLLEARWTDELAATQHTWPVEQGPSTAKLVLLMATAAEAGRINASTPVALWFYRQHTDTEPTATFFGRTSDPVIRPHELGVLVELTCADYLSDLAEHTVGDAAYPEEETDRRIARIFDAAEVAQPMRYDPFAPFEPIDFPTSWRSGLGPEKEGVWPELAARSASAASLLELAQRAMRDSVWRPWNIVTEGLSHWAAAQLYEIRPFITPGGLLDGGPPYVIHELVPELEANAPLRFVLDGAVWTVFVDEDDPAVLAVLVPAEFTSFDATWVRRTVADVNTLDVVLADQSVHRLSIQRTGEKRVTDRRETDLTGDWHPDLTGSNPHPGDPVELLADELLPAHTDVPGSTWEADRFVVEVDRADAPADWWPGELREVRTVSGLPEHHSPEGRSWWTGVVAFREVQLMDGECRVELGLIPRPLVARTWFGDPFHSITLDELPAGVTFTNIDPSLTVSDAAQIRA